MFSLILNLRLAKKHEPSLTLIEWKEWFNGEWVSYFLTYDLKFGSAAVACINRYVEELVF